MNRKYALSLAAILAVYGVGIVVFSQCRSLDRDEGYYAAAARLVAEGKTVYGGFFYPQAPALPYIYSLADRIGGSLCSLRLVSAMASVLMVLLWAVYLVDRHRDSPKVVFLSLLLIALDPHLAYWNVTVKTFGIGNLLLTAALVSLYFAVERDRKLGFALSGLCTAVLISVRLLYAPIAPVILGWLLLRDKRNRSEGNATAARGFAAALGYLIGLTLGGIPFLVIFLANPQAAMFGNLGYHALRATSPGWLEHVGYVFTFLAVKVCDPYLVLELALAVVGVVSTKASQGGRFIRLTTLLAAVFAVGTATPYPLNAHYFTGTLAPFLLPAAALGIATIGRRGVAVVAALALASGVVMMATGPFVAKARERLRDMVSVYRSGDTAGRQPVAAGNTGSEKSLASFRAISQYLQSKTQPQDVVLSFWPGYVYESHRQFLPGLEDDFGLVVAPRLNAAQRAAYKIAGQDDIVAAIRNRLPKAVVIGGYWMADFYSDGENDQREEALAALARNYELGLERGQVKVFLRRD